MPIQICAGGQLKGLWILPSRRRLGKLARFFEAATLAEMTTPGVVLVQKDEFFELKDEYDALKLPQGWKVLPTMADGMGDKCREIWPAIKNLDWVGLACDDLRPVTDGWDETLKSRINGKNIVTCNDGQQGSLRMAGITMFSGPLLRAIGYLYAPGFWHTYMDNVWEDIGRMTGCWTYVNDVLVLHDHPFTNQQLDPAKADETALKSYGQPQRDMQAYQQWVKLERDAIVARVKAL